MFKGLHDLGQKSILNKSVALAKLTHLSTNFAYKMSIVTMGSMA